ncbi:hypothetical protein BD414DRAFT_492369 [Trametes punicea]|nr:hypothetical protein BD414DRAFT_492369 [Trametes punicea]
MALRLPVRRVGSAVRQYWHSRKYSNERAPVESWCARTLDAQLRRRCGDAFGAFNCYTELEVSRTPLSGVMGPRKARDSSRAEPFLERRRPVQRHYREVNPLSTSVNPAGFSSFGAG